MKATQIIKDKGLDYAKNIVCNSPENALYWVDGYEFKCGQSGNDLSDETKEKYFVLISEIKGLIGSHDLVTSHNGLHGAKNTLKLFIASMWIGLYHGVDGVNVELEIPRLKQAIADVEACQ